MDKSKYAENRNPEKYGSYEGLRQLKDLQRKRAKRAELKKEATKDLPKTPLFPEFEK